MMMVIWLKLFLLKLVHHQMMSVTWRTNQVLSGSQAVNQTMIRQMLRILYNP